MINAKIPKVSIVIPIYNGSNYMREAIDSALNQTYQNIEVIVVNDGSSDNTEEIALSYGDKIRYYSKANGGVSTALNLGIQKMTGDYFCFLPHDDVFALDKIEKQIRTIKESNQDEAIVWSGWDMYIQNEHRYKKVIMPYENATIENMTKGIYPMLFSLITIVTVLFPKNYLDKTGEFDPTLSTAQDYDMMFRTFEGRNTIYLEEELVHYRWHSEQGTQEDEHFIQNCKDMARKMEQQVSDSEIQRLFGNKYFFYYCLLDHYKQLKWDDCYEELFHKFLLEQNSIMEEATRIQVYECLGMNSDDELILYCAGGNAKRLRRYLEQRGVDIDGYCDGSKKLIGTYIDGKRCVARNAVNKNAVIIVTKDEPENLVKELKQEGFENVISFKVIGPRIYSVVPIKEKAIESWSKM
jgi:glycosyltransferase involved in cell wall biosynthesis